MLIGGIGEFLSDEVRAIACKKRGYRLLCFCFRTFEVFQVVVLVAVGTVVGERGVRAKAFAVDIKIDRLRELGRYQTVSLDSTMEATVSEPQDEDDVDSIPAQVMLDMIASLPDVRRTVFNMYCIDGFSHKEIADAIHITEKGSASILAKSRAQLKNAINEYLKRTGR